MANVRLEIGTDTNVGIFQDIRIDLTLQISDISDPSNRKGSKSKTINIPGSQDVNILFENIFEVNISLQTFNPQLKTDATYYVDELPQLKGYIQLLNIQINKTTGQVVYECSLIGELTTLFTDIQGLFLTDIDFTNYQTGVGIVDYTHTLSYTNIINSWATTPGVSYVYPLIDWGVNNSNFNFVSPQHLRGCFFARAYLFAIFNMAGYTWTSTILDSTFFKRLIILPTDTPSLSSTVLSQNKFLAVADGTQILTNSLIVAGVTLIYASSTNNLISFQTETYDVGNHFNNTGAGANPNPYSFYPTTTNKYNTTANIGVNLVVKNNGVPDYNVTGVNGTMTIVTTFGSQTINTSSLNFTNGNSNNINVSALNIQLNGNTNYNCAIQFTALVLTSPAMPVAGPWTIEATIVSGSNFASEFATSSVYEGSTVNPNTLIPSNVLQTDFFKSIIQMFNLYVTVDKTNNKNLIIEDRNNFYTQSAIDWTYKHDANSITEKEPLGDQKNKRFIWKYKQDGDFLNKTYYDRYLETYGTEVRDLDNDFIKGEKPTEVIFSATPYTYPPNLPSMVIPAIYKKENGVVSPIKSNIRILYWSGTIALPTSQWTFAHAGGSPVYTTYPHAGHTNTPYAPTLDLSWDEPHEVYFNYPNATWTNNNLVNKYYNVQFQQTEDKNGAIITTYFNLTPLDIHTFDFRRPVFWKDAYYLVQSINYNPLVTSVSKVVLLKLTHYDEFVPLIDSTPKPGDDSQYIQQQVQGGNITKGDNNTNLGTDSLIMGGSGNYIAYG